MASGNSPIPQVMGVLEGLGFGVWGIGSGVRVKGLRALHSGVRVEGRRAAGVEVVASDV